MWRAEPAATGEVWRAEPAATGEVEKPWGRSMVRAVLASSILFRLEPRPPERTDDGLEVTAVGRSAPGRVLSARERDEVKTGEAPSSMVVGDLVREPDDWKDESEAPLAARAWRRAGWKPPGFPLAPLPDPPVAWFDPVTSMAAVDEPVVVAVTKDLDAAMSSNIPCCNCSCSSLR